MGLGAGSVHPCYIGCCWTLAMSEKFLEAVCLNMGKSEHCFALSNMEVMELPTKDVEGYIYVYISLMYPSQDRSILRLNSLQSVLIATSCQLARWWPMSRRRRVNLAKFGLIDSEPDRLPGLNYKSSFGW